MFNSTHTLVALALARAGLERWNRHAAWTAVIASNLPDIDIVVGLRGSPAYIEYHRGITHSILAMPLLSLTLAAVLYRWSGSFWKTFVVALVAMSTHPVLDYLNTYGLRPFLPFNGSWYYGDALFIIDPIFDAILIATLVICRLFPFRRRQVAWIGLVAISLYIGVRMELRNLSRSYLATFEKAAVSPMPLNPFRWIGLTDNPDNVSVFVISPFAGVVGGPERIAKQSAPEVAAKAAQSLSGSTFLRFARFPVTHVQHKGSGYTVTFFDVRYYDGSARALGARIHMDSEFRVIGESLSFTQRID